MRPDLRDRVLTRLLFLASLGALLNFSSCAATLRMRASAPQYDNDGSCAVPLLLSRAAQDSCWIHFAWSGPAAGEDSARGAPGQLVSLVRTVPAGLYQLRGWASDAGGIGCDTTIAVTVRAAPWKPRLQ
ncbi:MAG: hypothetical protein HZC42_06880 [Candidatus Eisenbacteria bacterium]|nr:hypothetical protein [Candidatus Eisenbacteria bacterium]